MIHALANDSLSCPILLSLHFSNRDNDYSGSREIKQRLIDGGATVKVVSQSGPPTPRLWLRSLRVHLYPYLAARHTQRQSSKGIFSCMTDCRCCASASLSRTSGGPAARHEENFSLSLGGRVNDGSKSGEPKHERYAACACRVLQGLDAWC